MYLKVCVQIFVIISLIKMFYICFCGLKCKIIYPYYLSIQFLQTIFTNDRRNQLGQVSSNFAAAKNGQVSSKFAAAKNGQVSSKFAAAKNGKVSSKFAAAKNGQVSSKFAAAKNGQVSSKFAAVKKINFLLQIFQVNSKTETLFLADFSDFYLAVSTSENDANYRRPNSFITPMTRDMDRNMLPAVKTENFFRRFF